jgi:hypothetical protein
MNKAEKEVQAHFVNFIRLMYAHAGLTLPKEGAEWESEEESMIVSNAIRAIGRHEAIAALLLAEKNEAEKTKLLNLVESL